MTESPLTLTRALADWICSADRLCCALQRQRNKTASSSGVRQQRRQVEAGETPTFPAVSMDVGIQGSAQNLKPGEPEMHQLYSSPACICFVAGSSGTPSRLGLHGIITAGCPTRQPLTLPNSQVPLVQGVQLCASGEGKTYKNTVLTLKITCNNSPALNITIPGLLVSTEITAVHLSVNKYCPFWVTFKNADLGHVS